MGRDLGVTHLSGTNARTDKEQKNGKVKPATVDFELERLKRNWTSRREELAKELQHLQRDPHYTETVKDLFNLIKALDVRERLLDARETTMVQKEAAIETQKQKLSQQAEHLAKLRNELELKINELEKRLATPENIE